MNRCANSCRRKFVTSMVERFIEKKQRYSVVLRFGISCEGVCSVAKD